MIASPYAVFKPTEPMQTFAIYQRHDNSPTRVLYSHLTEETAIDVVERMYATARDRGLPCSIWYEQHHPQAVFVIN